MRALLCKKLGSYEDLVVDTVDDPVPGDGQVLIDVKAAGLNFPDLLIIQGKYQARPDLPFTPGGECAGTVAAVGDGVTSVKVGDPVVGMALHGAFAEKVVIPEAGVLPIPMGMSFEAAAGISMTYGTSLYALKQRAQLRQGETLVVLGAAGGVGLAAVEIGKAMGATVIAAASSDEKLDTACAAGADHRINYSTESLKDRVKEFTGKKGADVVYDPVGGDYTEAALRATAWDGRFLVIGFAAGEIPKVPLNLPLLKGFSVVGVFWGTWIQRDPAGSRQNFRELRQMFEKGQLKPVFTAFPFAEYRAAYATLAERRAQGKVILQIGE